MPQLFSSLYFSVLGLPFTDSDGCQPVARRQCHPTCDPVTRSSPPGAEYMPDIHGIARTTGPTCTSASRKSSAVSAHRHPPMRPRVRATRMPAFTDVPEYSSPAHSSSRCASW